MRPSSSLRSPEQGTLITTGITLCNAYASLGWRRRAQSRSAPSAPTSRNEGSFRQLLVSDRIGRLFRIRDGVPELEEPTWHRQATVPLLPDPTDGEGLLHRARQPARGFDPGGTVHSGDDALSRGQRRGSTG